MMRGGKALPLTIAIDGPVGAGKSTISDAVAKKLDILHLDTGAMYRAFGLYAIRKGVDTLDEGAVSRLIDEIAMTVTYEKGRQSVFVNGEDVTHLIRTQEVSMAASDVSKWQAVRSEMVRLQQEIAKGQSMLLDGRDIGTVVLKDATVKIFLTASPEVRAKRRFKELKKKGASDSYEKVLEDLIARDFQDTNRASSPLRAAEDALVLDTSGLTFDEVVSQILAIVEAKR